ncbi:hypothetical protein [Elizabethkingia anophelis]|uniref:Uncharacterized protein n=4 Tax=Elizabethkingia anophelis TaxID=1117645 RepID=A0A455ZI88_9FLAO|nr:hypothetical protein [Elizabethkingia anophelis]ATC35591.1 hypothetical protein BAZ09_004905 [Elizabethkingia anophelis R26]ATC39229.1 hypothetical protein EAAG1_004905 [Elizabethkingia anophelis Ag1]ATC42910.1 hypothetical protein CMV41_04905 [Elizabethkingia anophelis]ATC46586.1 hypothetical protein CMV40_04905 [Elizabethkingia anophelis]ELR81192.1 hypothetical protein D505_00540 [Elizabethkingia anophelis R26]
MTNINKKLTENRTGMSLFLAAKNIKENVFFKLTELEGDKGIWLGQSILALIAINKSPAYSEEMNKGFIENLFASLIQELDITPEDLRRVIDQRKEWETEED